MNTLNKIVETHTISTIEEAETYVAEVKRDPEHEGYEVKGYKITGTLTKVTGGLSPSGPLSGDGYFLALSLYDSHAEIESMGDVKVGLKPSMGTGLVSIKGDVDDVIVMKITDNNEQRFEVVSTKTGYKTNIQSYDLSGLKLS